jgi:hypothetical protein
MSPDAQATPEAVRPTPVGPYLDIDPVDFYARFCVQHCSVHHRLCGHSLFEMPRLLALARRHPPRLIKYNAANLPVSATPAQTPRNGLSIEQTIRQIEDCQSWMMISHIEEDPEYRTLLHACLAEVEALGHPCTRDVFAREGYVFLSSPGAVTPYHMDPEINFLFQIRGRKLFYVVPGADRSVLPEAEIEQFYGGAHDSLKFREELRARATLFDLRAGDGVHVPVNDPHWAVNGAEVSISFAMTLQTEATRRRGVLYAVNHFCRRRGWNPTPVGRSRVRDALKYQGYRLCHGLLASLPCGRQSRAM